MSHQKSFQYQHTFFWLAVTALCSAPVLAKENVALSPTLNALNHRLLQMPPLLTPNDLPAGHTPSARDQFEKSYDLFIRYTEGSIYNPLTGKADKVKLRAYQQKTDKSWAADALGAARFQAPSVVVVPGQTVRYKLHNQLPEQVEKLAEHTDQTEVQCTPTALNAPGSPGCFNITNLHSHGLWISPSGNSDNVLLSIEPNVSFEYEYNVPVDHPAGTFWYHPHVHGTTAMQVGSGMTGALIVKGDRYPSPTGNGDLDTLLKKFEPKGGSSAEVMMLQQVPYACFDNTPDKPYSNYHTTYGKDKDGKPKEVGPWTCSENEVGVVESFGQVESPSIWRTSGRYTMINGQVQPKIVMADNTVYRWRLIDAGFQDTVKLRIKQIDSINDVDALLSGKKSIEEVCNGSDVWQFEVASDGLTHAKAISKNTNYLQPGYRSDILFALPNAGKYCVYDDKAASSLNNDAAKNARLLAVIDASKPGQAIGKANHATDQASQAKFMTQQLLAAAQTQPPSVREQVKENLRNDLQLNKFVPHPSFTPENLAVLNSKPKEYVTFNIAKVFDIAKAEDKTRFMVEGQFDPNLQPSLDYTYKPDRVDHTLILGTEQIWTLRSKAGSHPFHIHVNPFQIVGVKWVGKDPEDKSTDFYQQYQNLIGTWKDTLLVAPNYEIEIATRYQRYIGEYVLHCHILEHEDQGMMQNVKVVVPNGKGGASAGAHGAHGVQSGHAGH
ncbi:multicopper oxidase family protein [Undibacterium sp. Di26W]|uniref:multicopper oxidase family protein n=1 Tax=Undibacterium sp. Di26W TaxID=3413035 RepID=UPI003BF2B203